MRLGASLASKPALSAKIGRVSGSGVNSLDVANTLIAAAAFAAAAASLAWQAVTWKLEGSRASAELRVGALHLNPGIRDVITYPAGRSWSDVDDAGQHGFTRKALFLTVRSTGREPVTVDRWVVVFPGARRFISCALDLVQIYLTVSTSAGGENGPSS